MNDPWKQVAKQTKFLLASASTADDPRGAFIGLGLRVPDGVTVSPTRMQQALVTDDFAAHLVAILTTWGVISNDG